MTGGAARQNPVEHGGAHVAVPAQGSCRRLSTRISASLNVSDHASRATPRPVEGRQDLARSIAMAEYRATTGAVGMKWTQILLHASLRSSEHTRWHTQDVFTEVRELVQAIAEVPTLYELGRLYIR